MRMRRWLLHFTLFVAGVIIVGDLVALVRGFLDGELTLRFALKVLVVLVIAAGVFRYELWELRRGAANAPNTLVRIFSRIVTVLILVGIVAGFTVAGSPQSQRLARFDERRVENLQNIQWGVVSYWQHKHALPQTIAELADPIAGYVAPVDPKTSEPYEYSVVDELAFELCGTFETEQTATEIMPKRLPEPTPIGSEYMESWAHGATRTCFTRTIDPERYRLITE